MSVHKNNRNNTWYVKYKNTTKRGFKTKHEALQHEAKLKLNLIDNVYSTKTFFHDVSYDYLNYFKLHTTYGTYRKCYTTIKNIIIPNIQNKKISSINEMDCRKFYEYVSSLNYSTTHKNYILNKYKAIFKHAIKFYGLSHNPTNVITPLKSSFDEKIKKRNKENNIWTIDEFNLFINNVDKNIYKQLFVILYFTGMRLGEALALKWNDYDTNYLHINKSITRKTKNGIYEIKDTKNISSIRDIDVGITLKEYLNDFKKDEMTKSGFNDNWFIFGRLNPLPQTSIDRVKDKAIKKANVRRITLHQFRHSHASNLIANGISIVAVSKRLGHSDINMTLKVYTHLMKFSDTELINFIDKSSQNLLKQ